VQIIDNQAYEILNPSYSLLKFDLSDSFAPRNIKNFFIEEFFGKKLDKLGQDVEVFLAKTDRVLCEGIRAAEDSSWSIVYI